MLDLNSSEGITRFVQGAGFVSWKYGEDSEGNLEIKMLDEMEVLEFSPKLSKEEFTSMRKTGQRVYAWNPFTRRWIQIVSVEMDRLGNWQTQYQEVGSWEKGIRMGLWPLWLTSDTMEWDWKTVVRLWYGYTTA